VKSSSSASSRRARQRALDSEIIIVNHHLFFADLALRGKEWGQVLPDYDAVIFDEAHQIEDIAMQYFGAAVSTWQVADLIGDINRLDLANGHESGEILKSAFARHVASPTSSGSTSVVRTGKSVLNRECSFAVGPGSRPTRPRQVSDSSPCATRSTG
jgi:Rad3-related DNA helicase